MVVVHMDVGVSSTTNKCICDIQDSQHTHLEGKCKKKFFHNFRKMIALAWLCPTEYTNGKNLKCKNNDGNSSRSIRTINSSSLSNKKQKCAYITDDSIHPAHGSLKIWAKSRGEKNYHLRKKCVTYQDAVAHE